MGTLFNLAPLQMVSAATRLTKQRRVAVCCCAMRVDVAGRRGREEVVARQRRAELGDGRRRRWGWLVKLSQRNRMDESHGRRQGQSSRLYVVVWF